MVLGLFMGQEGEKTIRVTSVDGHTSVYYKIMFEYEAKRKVKVNKVVDDVRKYFDEKFKKFEADINTSGVATYYPTYRIFVSVEFYMTEENYTYATGYVIVEASSSGTLLMVIGRSD